MNFKHIHIGNLIKKRVEENLIDIDRICNFFKTNEKNIQEMYEKQSIDSETLLRWSKLLEYDFFRIYSQHLILFSPQGKNIPSNTKPKLPQFRKNIYMKEVIDFVIERIETEGISKKQIMEEYKIPKSTLHKWLSKYQP